MRFWDSSAIAALLVREPTSTAARRWLRGDQEIAAWWSTPAECWSALARLRREQILTLAQETQAHQVLEELRAAWLEIVPSDAVRDRARRLLRTHPLRAADALQLGAALVWAGDATGQTLVTFDERLGRAAGLEGFQIIG